MAIRLYNRYPSESHAPDDNYPYGSFRDRSSPTSKDGTKLQEDWANDFFSLHWALLKNAGVEPSGEIDTVENSQYYEALLKVIKDNSQNLTISHKVDGESVTSVASEKAVGVLNDLKVDKSGDTMTGDLSIVEGSPTVSLRNSTIPANNIGARVNFTNNAGVGTFSTTNEDGSREVRHILPNRGGVLALGNTAVGAINGELRDTVTGITFKWGEVNYDKYPGEIIVSVTFDKPFETDCYSVQLTRKQVGLHNADVAVHLISNDKNGFKCVLQHWSSHISTNHEARGFTWFAIGK